MLIRWMRQVCLLYIKELLSSRLLLTADGRTSLLG